MVSDNQNKNMAILQQNVKKMELMVNMYDDEVHTIIHAGLIFIVYLFVAIILYYFLSSPVSLIFDSISSGATGTNAESYMGWMLPNIRWALNVAFALGLAFPVTWFIVWVFKQETDFGMYRRW